MTHTVTLVSDVHVSKTEALAALSEVFDREVDTTDPANAVIGLEGGVVLSIEVPKFGEDLPLTLDLTGPDKAGVVRVSNHVITTVGRWLKWQLRVVGDG